MSLKNNQVSSQAPKDKVLIGIHELESLEQPPIDNCQHSNKTPCPYHLFKVIQKLHCSLLTSDEFSQVRVKVDGAR